MVTGDAVADAVERAKRLPRLGVGLHLVLVDGRPALPAERVSRLVGSDGRFRTDMVRAGIAIFADPRARRQLREEVEAQFAAFAATGLTLDHVNAHKHFHLHPTIASTVLEAGKRYGVRAMRAPVEPKAVLRRIEAGQGFDPAAPWAKLMRRRIRRAGMVAPDQVFGIAWSGKFGPARLKALIAALPPGLSEIYMHPATGPYPGSAAGYDYAGELAALTDPQLRQAVVERGIEPVRFLECLQD